MSLEVGQESSGSQEVTQAPPLAPTAPTAPETPPPAAPKEPEIKPELTLREKIEKKAADVAAKREKDPKTGQFKPKVDSEPPVIPPLGMTVPAVKPAPDAPVLPGVGVPKVDYTPNFKLKVMEKELEIPELLRPLVKDAESEKAVREIMEKAYGLDYVKPKLEQARTQLTQVSGENTTIKNQIQHARTLYQRGDIEGWFKYLQVPQEKVLQWVADRLNYEQLPPEQKSVLDSRKQAEERAWTAEDQASTYQQQNEQILTQQVQMALESSLARPDVDTVAKAFDARMGAGAFKAEVQRRGDYIWRTENKLVPPDKLVTELLAFLGPIAPAAPVAPQAPAAAAQAALVTPATPAAPAGKTPTIPNISGRSASAVTQPKVKSIADIRAKYKELQAGNTG